MAWMISDGNSRRNEATTEVFHLRNLIGLCLTLAFVSDPMLQAQTETTHPTITNTLDMKFVWIAPGTFMMGSPKEENSRKNDETQHKVALTHGFYMAIYTVTQEQWTQLMGKNPSKFQDGRNLPVEQVSWADCQEFIKKLQDKEKKPYRLPSEAEWEYACRAGTTTPFYTGETISVEQANYNGNFVYADGKKGIYREKTMPIGSFPANPWGLYDMAGNVWQWCADMFDEYPKKEVIDPQVTTGENRVIRGGSWIDNPRECRSAYRGGSKPTLRHSLVGLRLCFSVE